MHMLFGFSFGRLALQLCSLAGFRSLCVCVLRCSFAEWQRLSEIYPRRLSFEQGQSLHDVGIQALHFHHAAAWFARGQRKLRYLITPKFHVFHHLCLDAVKELWNPRACHNFSGEDYIGYLKAVVVSTNTADKLEVRVLRRALLKAVALKF